MNEFDAMHQILSEWKDVARIKSLNQQLYDQLLGGIINVTLNRMENQRYS